MLTELPVRPGDVLVGKYRVDRVLGVGGMGVVVAASHIALDERVALKFLLPHVVQHPQAIARFLREARAAVKIRSEHVARVTDVGTLETGAPYIVMEYLVGHDLDHRVAQTGPLPVDEAIDYVLQACEALAEAHALGIIHRDLKPANLFLTTRADGSPCVKVLDFGIAKVGEASGGSLTVTGGVMGSALYMSPEQLQSAKDVDARTDVWALGVVLYELLTGQHPFMAESLGQLAVQVLTQPPRNFWELRRDVPEPVVSAIASTLVKDRVARCASVAELAERVAPYGTASAALSLSRIQRLAGTSSRSLPTPTPFIASAPPGNAHGVQPGYPPTTTGLSNVALPTPPLTTQRSRRGVLVAFAIAGVIGMAGGAVVYVASRDTSNTKSTTPLDQKDTKPKDSTKSTPSPAAAPPQPSEPPASPSSANVVPAAPSPAAPAVVKPTPTTSALMSATVKPSAPAVPNCEPPYVYDKQGIKHFKPGCE